MNHCPWRLLFVALSWLLLACACVHRMPLKQVPLPPNSPPQEPEQDTTQVPAPEHQPSAGQFVVRILPTNKDQAFATRLELKYESDLYPKLFFLEPGNAEKASSAGSTDAKGGHAPTGVSRESRFYPATQEEALIADPQARPLHRIEIRLEPADATGRPRVRIVQLEWSTQWKTEAAPFVFVYPKDPVEQTFHTGRDPFPESRWLDELTALLPRLSLGLPVTKSAG